MGNKVPYTRKARRTAAQCLNEFDQAVADGHLTSIERRQLRRLLERTVHETSVADAALSIGSMVMKGVETREYMAHVVTQFQVALDAPQLSE